MKEKTNKKLYNKSNNKVKKKNGKNVTKNRKSNVRSNEEQPKIRKRESYEGRERTRERELDWRKRGKTGSNVADYRPDPVGRLRSGNPFYRRTVSPATRRSTQRRWYDRCDGETSASHDSVLALPSVSLFRSYNASECCFASLLVIYNVILYTYYIYISTYTYIRIYLSVYLFIYQFIYLSIYLPFSLSFSQVSLLSLSLYLSLFISFCRLPRLNQPNVSTSR